MNLPLKGIKVVELGTHVAVPTTSRLMADWGAEVIKVEGLGGDEWRLIGAVEGTPFSDDCNVIFTLQNANKNFIGIDLKNEEGKKALLKLIASADVFISSVRKKSLQKLGIWYDDIKKINPEIIYAHFNGFGYEGEEADRPGFDMAAFWSRSGLLIDSSVKGTPPIKPIGGMGDSTASSLFLNGILSAIIGKLLTGKGTFVSSSLLGSGIWFGALGVISAYFGNEFPKDYMDPPTPFTHAYRCKDGEWVQITVIDYDGNFKKMCTLLEIEDVIENPKFGSIAECKKNMPEFVGIVSEAFKKKNRTEWAEIFSKANVVYEFISHLSDVSKDKQAWANGYLKEVPFQSGQKVPMPMPPIKFSEYEEKDFVTSGAIGRDSSEILKSVGYTEEEIKKAREAKGIK